MNTRKLKLLVELTLPEGVSDTAMKSVVKRMLAEASREAQIEGLPHANFAAKVRTWKQDPLLVSQAQTITEQDEQLLVCAAKIDQLAEALESLKVAPTAATTINTIQTINAIIHSINQEEVHIPTSSYSKTEHFKAGAREQRRAVNEAIRRIGGLLVAGIPQPSDAELFAYWIQEAELRPMRIMKALSGVSTIQQYRDALVSLRNEDQRALIDGTAALVKVEGTLQ